MKGVIWLNIVSLFNYCVFEFFDFLGELPGYIPVNTILVLGIYCNFGD